MNTFRPAPAALARRAVAAVLAATLAACGTVPRAPGTAPETPAERQLRDDEARMQQTVIAGVVTVALQACAGGVLVGVVLGESSKELKKNCLRWALLGAIGGGADAYRVATLERARNDRVRALQLATDDVRQDNERLQRLLASGERALADGRARLQSLRSEQAAGRIAAAEADAARQREAANIETLNRALEQARQTRAQYAAAGTQLQQGAPASRDLERQMDQMNRQIGQLERQIVAYNDALRVSRV